MSQTSKQRITRKKRKLKYDWLTFYRKVYKDIQAKERPNVPKHPKNIVNNVTEEVIDSGIIAGQLFFARRSVDIILKDCCIKLGIKTDKIKETEISLRLEDNKLTIADIDAHKCMVVRGFIERLIGYLFKEVLHWKGISEISGSVKYTPNSVCSKLHIKVFREAGFAVTFSKGMCHFYLAV